MYTLDVIQQELKEDIARFGRVVYVNKGEILMRPEECMEHFFVILEGRVKISQINFETGKEQILYLLSNGDMYDIITLLDAKVHENVAMALDNVKLLVFPIELFREWIETKPSFNKLFLPYVAKQLREVETLASDLSLYDTTTRLIKLIAKNIETQGDKQTLKLINNLSHEELASLVGTVRKVLNRNLQSLKKQGLIDIKRKEIFIKDSQNLLEHLPEE
ncbi:Crp/Fnr family transcriptional regulator [Sulfurospirillum diekertiae]|uniref:CRP-like cAMP-activated global transcriptional regulator n=1 Tax=Sulfurospirillum diekertiae TaxID=1854492 RepID=A0A1Y0HHU4_9BACT|nr:Crp/Fnr family transcriptional regulator [Sulfurospirillum diekertiae]ARU47677.1 CRP-like cAMP-activated global transcriptional regulator [Sulfurospirillum diekertiae]ASC92522.1 CRP-like cAMP-activated global transcriptional regulator [Sulfurospirillum diekertiae]